MVLDFFNVGLFCLRYVSVK